MRCGREVYSFIKKSNGEDGEKFVRGLPFFRIDFSASPGSCGHTGSLPPVLRVRHVRGAKRAWLRPGGHQGFRNLHQASLHGPYQSSLTWMSGTGRVLG